MLIILDKQIAFLEKYYNQEKSKYDMEKETFEYLQRLNEFEVQIDGIIGSPEGDSGDASIEA